MISIETIRLKLMTMAATLIAAWRGVAFNCAIAIASGARTGTGNRPRQLSARRGMTSTEPSRISPIAT